MATTTIRTYEELLNASTTPTPYPYRGRAISGGWDGGDFEVAVLAHRRATEPHFPDTWLVQVEGEGFSRRWLGAGAVALAAPLTITQR